MGVQYMLTYSNGSDLIILVYINRAVHIVLTFFEYRTFHTYAIAYALYCMEHKTKPENSLHNIWIVTKIDECILI